ncbi:MAG: hypothetical protein FWC26_09750 [Fibromonadales bacterium]|nr:hypothetical protein [Fibromonadales bacterium]
MSKWHTLYEASDFPVNRDCNIYRNLTEVHYNKMRELLKISEEKEYEYLSFLLKQVWKKYENELRVNNSKARDNEVGFYKNENTGIYGVYINIDNHTQESNDGWYAAYQTIFHEFFHNIDHLAGYKSYTYKNKNFDHSDKEYQFGEIIISEIRKSLLEEEKNAGPKEKTRLRTITYDITDRRHKAALYDIIGAVLNYGKYGCNPNNSEFYTEDGKKCGDKCVCNPLSKTNPKTAICEFRTRGLSIYDRCSNSKECSYKRVCSLRANDWCNVIHGHGSNYWLVKEKGSKEDDKESFPMRLAEEAFALMASEAVANRNAFGNLKKYLPKSYDMFVEILKEMLKEEFELWGRLWSF